MRLDKFLKVSRLIKRRTVAKELAAQGRVIINGQKAKAGSTLAEGDTLTVQYGQKVLTVEVKTLKDSAKKDEAGELYEVIKEEPMSS